MQQPHDNNGTNFFYRIEALERDVKEKVPINEYNLQTKITQEAYARIENGLAHLITQVTTLQDKIVNLEIDAQKRDGEQKQALSGLQLRLFYALLGLFGLLAVSLATYYFTHAH